MACAGTVTLVLCLISSSLSHPYGPAASSHHQQQQQQHVSASSYQSSGNDQLRFHPEESQYYSNEQQPTNNAAPSYADLVNLSAQEAQQQAIIAAQKKLETNKIVKDIEFIQKQQDMLQAQIREQEIKNEQKLNNPGSYSSGQSTSGYYGSGQTSPGSDGSAHKSTGSYGSAQNTPQGTFNSGQWVADGNANKFDDGLYKGDGSHNKATPNDGSYVCDDGCSDETKSKAQITNFQQTSIQQQTSFQQTQQSVGSTGYGGSPSPSQPQSGGFPEFQSPLYPSPNPSTPTFPSNPSGSYGGSQNSQTFPPKPTGSYGGSSGPVPFPSQPTGSYGGSPSPAAFPPKPTGSYGGSPSLSPVSSQPTGSYGGLPSPAPFPQPQQPLPNKPSYGGSGASHQQQHQHQNTQDYWWNGPNSPFSPNQLSNCNHLDCNPPAINKPPPPKPSYGPTGPAPQNPSYAPPIQPPPQAGPAEPVNIAQNPYLSGALNNKPLTSFPQPPSYGPPPHQQSPPVYSPPQPPTPSFVPPQSPPSSYGPTSTGSVYTPSQQPYEPPPPPPNSPQEFPQKPFPTKPTYEPSPPAQPSFQSPPPSFPLTNPDSPSGGYGSSGGGTPGVSFPEYQPSDVQRVPCTQPGHTCIAKHLCVNGKVNNNGIGLIQLRISMKSCRADIEVCCEEDAPGPHTGGYGQPSKPASGYQPPVDSYGQPTDSYESCNVCGATGIVGGTGNTGSYSHQQSHHSEESASYHKETSSSVSHGANLPRAKLPDFVPPSATATLPILKQGPSAGGYGK